MLEKRTPPLHSAAEQGNIPALGELLVEGASIDARFSTRPKSGPYFCQLTPMMVGAWSRDAGADTLKFLLDRGADPAATSEARVTALFYSVLSGDVEKVQTMLDAGANPCESSWNGTTALMVAAGHFMCWELSHPGSPECTKALIEAGADILPRNVLDLDALDQAIRGGSAECVRLLLQAGATIDPNSLLALENLVKAGSAATARILVEHGVDPLQDFDHSEQDARMKKMAGGRFEVPDLPFERPKEPAVFDAAREDSDAIAVFIESGVDVDATNQAGKSLLQIAASNGRARTVQALLDCGARIAPPDKDGTALHAAVRSAGDPVPTIDVLLRGGANIDTPDGEGCTPLHRAVAESNVHQREGLVSDLIARGADLEARDAQGDTPFLRAVARGAPQTLRILADAGANTKATRNGTTAEQLARSALKEQERSEAWFRREHPELLRKISVTSSSLCEDHFGAETWCAVEAEYEKRAEQTPEDPEAAAEEIVEKMLSGRLEWERIMAKEEIVRALSGKPDRPLMDHGTPVENSRKVLEILKDIG